MPNLITSSVQTTQNVGSVLGTFFKKTWWIFLIVALAIILLVLLIKLLLSKKYDTYGKRKLEIIKSAQIVRDKNIKKVLVYDGKKFNDLGKYIGHAEADILIKKVPDNLSEAKRKAFFKDNTQTITYVLISNGFGSIIDFIFDPKILVAPVEAVKELWMDNQKNISVVAQSLEYNHTKKMYFATGLWKGLEVAVSRNLIDKNVLELFEDYTAKLGVVQDQTVQQLDLDMKKKMKGLQEEVDDDDDK